jgi:hypothetical protein
MHPQQYTGLLHALRANQHILPGEDPAEFLALLQNRLDRLQPIGTAEEHVVLRIAACQWRLARTMRMQPGKPATPPPITEPTKLARYEASIARSLAHSLRLLKIYREARIASTRSGTRSAPFEAPAAR